MKSFCLFALSLALTVQAQSPFKTQAQLQLVDGGERLSVTIGIPPEHYLYANMFETVAEAPEGVKLIAIDSPKTKRKYDEVFEKEVDIYESDARFVFSVVGRNGAPLKIKVSYQGCNASTCFLPQDDMFVLSDVTAGEMQAEATAPHDTSPASGEATDLDALAAQFRVGGIDVGYMAPDKFLAFLDNAEAGTVAAEKDRLVQRVFRRYGLLTVMLLLIPLGFLLNLTPCVLPMIPVNLAIIGAGAQSGSRTRGFALGGIYGLGMALVYGVLGLVVVLTGQQFGALNASPWFSLSITILFAVLALAMFDVFEIDLSRFQKRSAGSEDGGSKSLFATAFVLGGTAALLAGACVAPVLISTLVLAANLYQTNPAALLLPFMLGVGMALPWPFAGAGMSFLPKPGAWMDRVKKVFGVLILGVAIFYGILAVHQFRPAATDGDHKQTDVAAALQQGLDEGKPVLLDFWSLSCKACKAMDRNVFPNPTVHKRLEGYVFSGVQTDLTDRADVEWAVEHFDIKGLPTYVVLVPLKADGTD